MKESAGMIVVKTIVMGPNQPNENTLKRKKTVPPRGHLEPSQAVCWSSRVLITGRIQEKELLPGGMGMTSALLLVQLSLEGLDC